MEKKILIVGGGLAGLCVGIQLFRRGIPFQIWTSPDIPCSSEKAAGLMNPVVVKRLLKTWMADEVIPYNQEFYPEVERLTNSSFYSQLPVYRVFNNALVQGEWKARVADGSMVEFMSPEIYAYKSEIINDNGFGGADIFQAAMVDCEVFVHSLRSFFQANACLLYKELDYNSIEKQEEGYAVLGEFFSKIIFCEGLNALQNPWFGKLPFVPTKGELVYLDIPDFPREKEVMKGVFLAPLMKGGFVCGSTYEWQFEDGQASENGKNKILDQFHEITDVNYKLIKHTAGIRPASRDRRPYLGQHPSMKGMYIFNGLGTKGYMLAPYLSSMLISHVIDQTEINSECNINRLGKRGHI